MEQRATADTDERHEMGMATRTIGKLAAVLAVAVLFLGGPAAAGAAPRSQAVARANDFILGCTAQRGDPVVVMDSTGESLTVFCQFPDGRVSVCQFLPVEKDCQWVGVLKAPTRTRSNVLTNAALVAAP